MTVELNIKIKHSLKGMQQLHDSQYHKSFQSLNNSFEVSNSSPVHKTVKGSSPFMHLSAEQRVQILYAQITRAFKGKQFRMFKYVLDKQVKMRSQSKELIGLDLKLRQYKNEVMKSHLQTLKDYRSELRAVNKEKEKADDKAPRWSQLNQALGKKLKIRDVLANSSQQVLLEANASRYKLETIAAKPYRTFDEQHHKKEGTRSQTQLKPSYKSAAASQQNSTANLVDL